MFELSELMKKAEGILAEDGLNTNRGGEIDEGIRSRARSLVEHDILRSLQYVPLNRMQDRKDLKPWQGKESDAEVAFNFESLTDAQDVFDFVVNSGMLEHGEVRLVTMDDQHSVHFASHVMVIKPDVIQAVMLAYKQRVRAESVGAYNQVAEDIADVLHLRETCKSKQKKTMVKVSYEECMTIDIVSRLNEHTERAAADSLYTRYWDGLESVAESIATVITKLADRPSVTEDDAKNVIKAIQFLGSVQGFMEMEEPEIHTPVPAENLEPTEVKESTLADMMNASNRLMESHGMKLGRENLVEGEIRNASKRMMESDTVCDLNGFLGE